MIPFLGANTIQKDLPVMVFGIPFDGTSSYRGGSRFAPQYIREASNSIETFSPYQKLSLDEYKFFDNGDMQLPIGDVHLAVDMIYKNVKKNLDKIQCIIGGEHLITYPILKALREKIKNRIVLLDFDAHTDLRDEYLGVKLSHSTVIRRILELNDIELISVGIRAGTREEFEFLKNKSGIYSINDYKEINSIIQGKSLYVTIDMDVFDPGYVPGVGNPEPGGISFNQFINFLVNLSFKNLIGFDIVEINPVYDQSNISSIFAAVIMREMLLKLFKDKFNLTAQQ